MKLRKEVFIQVHKTETTNQQHYPKKQNLKMMKARTSSNASPLLSEHTPNNTKTKPTLEQKIRQYLAVFDGKTKDFSDVEHLFDALFHSDYSSTNQHYRHETRDQIKTLHSKFITMGTIAK